MDGLLRMRSMLFFSAIKFGGNIILVLLLQLHMVLPHPESSYITAGWKQHVFFKSQDTGDSPGATDNLSVCSPKVAFY